MESAEGSPSRQSLGARDAALLALHEEFYNRRAWLTMQAFKKIATAQTADDNVPATDRICKPTIEVVGAITTTFLSRLWSCVPPLSDWSRSFHPKWTDWHHYILQFDAESHLPKRVPACASTWLGTACRLSTKYFPCLHSLPCSRPQVKQQDQEGNRWAAIQRCGWFDLTSMAAQARPGPYIPTPS